MADVTAPQFQQDVNNAADWANGDENTTVTMRLGQQADSPAKVIKRVDDLAAAQREDIYENATPYTVGNFTDGFTYTALNQRGEFGGDQYVFLGGLDGLPHVVAPATDPTLSPSLYAKANYNDAASIANNDGTTSQDTHDAVESILIAQGLSGKYGFFAKGFTYANEGDVGIDSNGFLWSTYNPLPFTVTAGTVPESGSVYKKINFYNPIKKTRSSKDQIKGLINASKLKVAILGDSTEAGVGISGASSYGEANGWDKGGWAQYLYYSLIQADATFNKVIETHPDYTKGLSDGKLSCPFPALQLTKAGNSYARFSIFNNSTVNTDKVCIYHNSRTSDAACVFRVTIYDKLGSQIGQQVIDTYIPPINYVSETDVLNKISKTVITVSSVEKEYVVVLDQVDTLDRGNGQAANGTALFFGSTFGEGVLLENIAVSSTTLKEGSDANIMRGVDTSERLSLAQSLNANTYFIGWGTNDSKDGVSTPGDFYNEYKSFISEIRDFDPQSVIFLITDPRGANGSIYENNSIYNEITRQVAFESGAEVIDIESMFDQIGSSAYADDVHPNVYGYNIITGCVRSKMGVSLDSEQINEAYIKDVTLSKTFYNISPSSDSSGSFVTIHSETLTPPINSNRVIVTAKVVAGEAGDINGHVYRIRLLDVSSGSSVILDLSQVTQAAVAGSAIETIYLTGEYSPSNLSIFDGGDIEISVQGRDYNLASTNATHKMIVEWVA